MSFASYVVGYSELNEDNKAREYLSKFNTYFNGPFQVKTLLLGLHFLKLDWNWLEIN